MKKRRIYLIIDESTEVAIRSYYVEQLAMQEYIQLLASGRAVYMRCCYE